MENAKANPSNVELMLVALWDLSARTVFVKRVAATTIIVPTGRFVKILAACLMRNADKTLTAAWAPSAIEALARKGVVMMRIAQVASNAKAEIACQRWRAVKTLTARPILFVRVTSVLPTYRASAMWTAQANSCAMVVCVRHR